MTAPPAAAPAPEWRDQPRLATWCILPWVHLFADEAGRLRPCCMALESPDLVNAGPSGAPFVVYDEDGIGAGWNSSFMRGLRRALLSGQRPKACQRCFRDEDLGMRSHRQMSNALFVHLRAQALAATADDFTVPATLIRSLDLRLGNRCNLKCRMCSPVSSRATLSDYAALHGVTTDHPHLRGLMGPDWVPSPAFRRTFAQLAAHAERVHLSGGEPLVLTEMAPMLQELIDSGRAPHIDLHYVTNLTVLPPRLFELWSRFRRLGMVVSLDAIGAAAEYIRHLTRWPVLDANLRQLDARAVGWGCERPRVNITVQAYNVLRLDEVVAYVAEELPHFARPKLSLLYFPEHLGVRALSPELKLLAADRLNALDRRLAQGWPGQWDGEDVADIRAAIAGIIDYMGGGDDTGALTDRFRHWTETLDQLRGEDVRAALPELAPLFATPGAPP